MFVIPLDVVKTIVQSEDVSLGEAFKRIEFRASLPTLMRGYVVHAVTLPLYDYLMNLN